MQDMQALQNVQATGAELIDADAVARMLKVDRSTVYRMAGTGRLPAVKVGRQWRFPAEAIEAVRRLDDGDEAVPLVLDRGLVEPFIEVVAEALGVMMVVTDVEGRPLTRVVNPCPWFAERADDPGLMDRCVAEWRLLAAGLDFAPHFRLGPMGFECARAFVRSGPELVGMVLAGGVSPQGITGTGLYELDDTARQRVLAALPKLATALSRLAGHRDDQVAAEATAVAEADPTEGAER